MEGHLAKHILPRFGACPWNPLTKRRCRNSLRVDLKRSMFDRRKPDGALIKTYRLSRKSILDIVGIAKLVWGRKVGTSWELDLGSPLARSSGTSRRIS
jgi:hypothetical protein